MESVFKLLYHIHTHIHSTNASTQNDAYDVWQMNSVCLYRKMYRCTPMEFKERQREKKQQQQLQRLRIKTQVEIKMLDEAQIMKAIMIAFARRTFMHYNYLRQEN